MVFIYVLRLQNDKYYVGKTTNPKFRLEGHFNNNGSEWTKLYKPKQILELIPDCDDYDEDKYTKMYMDIYGIDNVRGGSYTTVNLDYFTKNLLIKMSNSTNNRCFKCGGCGHFSKNCKEDNTVWCCEYCNKDFEDQQKCEYHEIFCKNKKNTKNFSYNDVCFCCGRKGHYASTCYATKHIKGYYLNR